MESLQDKINDFENRIQRLENNMITDAISYGVVKHYMNWDLYFEQVDNKDTFVMRDRQGIIMGVFTEV